jgi:hypothetical protein
MSRDANGHAESLEAARARLVKRLRGRQSEIEEVIFAQARSVPDPVGGGDAEYLAGLRATVMAVVDYGLTGIEQGEEWTAPIPLVAVAQAHRAARNGVGLETVLLRYAAGHRHLGGFVMAEADQFPSHALRYVLDVQGLLLERLMAAISAEYKCEVGRVGRSLEQRRGERVQRLLAGEPVDQAQFDYEFDDAWHLGMIAIGARAREAVRGLAAGSDLQLLPVSRGEKTMWAWLGGESRLLLADADLLPTMGATDVLLAVGEPGRGIQGWRLTHHQAQAALLVALHRPQGITRYVEDMLLAAALQNETLARSLEEIYLLPLASQRDGGTAWRATLRAYFDARRNAATAAHTIKRDRHTVERRLQSIEKRLGRLLHTCEAELNVALRLHELGVVACAGDPSLTQRAER